MVLCPACGVRAFGQHECNVCWNRYPSVALVRAHQFARFHPGGHVTQAELDAEAAADAVASLAWASMAAVGARPRSSSASSSSSRQPTLKEILSHEDERVNAILEEDAVEAGDDADGDEAVAGADGGASGGVDNHGASDATLGGTNTGYVMMLSFRLTSIIHEQCHRWRREQALTDIVLTPAHARGIISRHLHAATAQLQELTSAEKATRAAIRASELSAAAVVREMCARVCVRACIFFCVSVCVCVWSSLFSHVTCRQTHGSRL